VPLHSYLIPTCLHYFNMIQQLFLFCVWVVWRIIACVTDHLQRKPMPSSPVPRGVVLPQRDTSKLPVYKYENSRHKTIRPQIQRTYRTIKSSLGFMPTASYGMQCRPLTRSWTALFGWSNSHKTRNWKRISIRWIIISHFQFGGYVILYHSVCHCLTHIYNIS